MPVRATVTSFGPVLLSKVLGPQRRRRSPASGWSSTSPTRAGLPLLDLKDLRAVISHLTGDEGKAELAELGGLSKATAGVILRELMALEAGGGDVFFGEPEFDTADLLRTHPDGRGVLSIMGLTAVQDRPALFSTFLMWLLADLFADLPEVGDVEQPKLVFFLDEAHLLFDDASEAFLDAIARTVRLIRSKGVGVFFVTQTPKDVPSEVLAQLGNRVQHALRAFTPDDAKALKATVSTFPRSEAYDLGELLTSMGTGEAAVTVLSERGDPDARRLDAPAPTRLAHGAARPGRARPDRAPPRRCSPSTARRVDRDSAYERLLAKVAPDDEPRAGSRGPARRPASAPARRAREPRAACRRCSAAACSAASRGRRPARPAVRSAARCSAPRLADAPARARRW